MDGTSWLLRYRELSGISVPSLIMGETVDQSQIIFSDGSLRDWIARSHAAIDRDDSYRVDVNGANHYSFSNYCDAWQVFFNKGWLLPAELEYVQTNWPCSSTVPPAVTISSADEHAVVTKYMIAFLDTYFGHPNWLDRWILTPEYALSHTPTVQFFRSEDCKAALPDDSYFRYRPYQVSSECDVAQKDPTGWFTSQSASSNSAQMLLTPAPGWRFRFV